MEEITVQQVVKPKRVVISKSKAAAAAAEKVEKPVYLTYEDYPIEDLLVYAGIDTIATTDLLAAIAPKVFNEQVVKEMIDGKIVERKCLSGIQVMERTEMVAQDFIIDLEVNGMLYDVEGNYRMKALMANEIERLRAAVFAGAGFEFDLNSEKQIVEALYTKLNFPIISTSKTGGPSTDGDTFKALSKQLNLNWLKDFAKYKDVNGTYNTFIKNYVKDFVRSDGRIHPNYNMIGTSSSRLTGEDPNLLQLPRGCHEFNIRELFIVPDGKVMICLDFNSCEVKVLGALSKDPALLKAIKEGKDFHSFSACAMLGLDYDEFIMIINSEDHPKKKEYKLARQNAKALS